MAYVRVSCGGDRGQSNICLIPRKIVRAHGYLMFSSVACRNVFHSRYEKQHCHGNVSFQREGVETRKQNITLLRLVSHFSVLCRHALHLLRDTTTTKPPKNNTN